ncbi:MAG: hypothetical protein SFX73_02205 [Kofleriaceae bacterium]|nr:hypothetical protein [Kofleriaceae bacterium]
MKLPLSVLDLSPVGAKRLDKPYAMCAVTVICGESDEEAQRLAAPVRIAIVNSRTGRRAPIPTVEEALATKLDPSEQAIADDFLVGAVIGGPATVRDRLVDLARDIDADELMISSLVPSTAARVAALERIATMLAS